MVYLILINDFRDKKGWLEWSLIVGTTLGAIWGIVFWKLFWHKSRFEIISLGAPNRTATFLSIVFLFVIAKIIWDERISPWSRKFLFFSALILGISLILGASRGAFVGLGASFLVLSFLKPDKKMVAVFLLLIGSIGIGAFFYKDLGQKFLNPQNLYSRFQDWQEAFQAFKTSPIIGGAARICYADPDNLYISILAKMGLLGFIGLVMVIIGCIQILLKSERSYYKYAGIAILTSILTNGIFETTFTHESALAFIIISALM
ncbi:MAG: O-antigen ligase family protein [Candidatus Desulfofervidaceae bacterium]|nr:O-antigen ligase family protein [Candidatus Desulfofervidaceae bacterium]